MVEKLNNATLAEIAKIIGDLFTGSKIADLLKEANIDNISHNSTKWKVLYDCFIQKQKEDNCSNNILAFIETCFNPVRFTQEESSYEDKRNRINIILSFSGLEITKEGKLVKVSEARTISEAKQRANRFKKHLTGRNIHEEISIYCGDEIEVENYFHVVFEATKGIFDKIRIKTKINKDGADLVDEAFSFNGKIPYLALNKLETESEKSEQKGFINLIKGVYGTFRTPEAHEVKIKWIMKEDDALDILSLISFIYKKIDNSIEARKNCGIN